MVGAFCERTEALASEHTLLLAHQQVQAHAQQQASAAVQSDTKHSVEQLVEHQGAREAEINHALVETRHVLLQQRQEFAHMQNRGNAIQVSIDECLRNVLSEAQSETQALINHQAIETRRVEDRITAAIRDAHSDLYQHMDANSTATSAALISNLVEETWLGLKDQIVIEMSEMVRDAINESTSTQETSLSMHEVKVAVHESTEQAETRIEQKMRQQPQESFQQQVAKMEDMHAIAMKSHVAILPCSCMVPQQQRSVEQKPCEALRSTESRIRIDLQRRADCTGRISGRLDENESKINPQLDAINGRIAVLECRSPATPKLVNLQAHVTVKSDTKLCSQVEPSKREQKISRSATQPSLRLRKLMRIQMRNENTWVTQLVHRHRLRRH